MNPLAPLEELHGPSFSDQRSETRKPRVSAQVRRNINEYWKTKLETLENKIVPEHEVLIIHPSSLRLFFATIDHQHLPTLDHIRSVERSKRVHSRIY